MQLVVALVVSQVLCTQVRQHIWCMRRRTRVRMAVLGGAADVVLDACLHPAGGCSPIRFCIARLLPASRLPVSSNRNWNMGWLLHISTSREQLSASHELAASHAPAAVVCCRNTCTCIKHRHAVGMSAGPWSKHVLSLPARC